MELPKKGAVVRTRYFRKGRSMAIRLDRDAERKGSYLRLKGWRVRQSDGVILNWTTAFVPEIYVEVIREAADEKLRAAG